MSFSWLGFRLVDMSFQEDQAELKSAAFRINIYGLNIGPVLNDIFKTTNSKLLKTVIMIQFASKNYVIVKISPLHKCLHLYTISKLI